MNFVPFVVRLLSLELSRERRRFVREFLREHHVLHLQRVFRLTHTPRQHRTHVQLAPDRLRVNLTTLVAEGRRARDDPQLPQLGQAVNERLGDSVREIFRVWIISGIC